MKQFASLFIAACAMSFASQAQISLSGSSYTQNFDGIGSGLPAGWSVYTGASTTSLGTDVSSTKFTATPVRWQATTGGFRNSASADAFTLATYTTDSAAQAAVTDRALSVRQVGATSSTFPGSDSGAAFVMQIANTTGLDSFTMSFKLQSLDTSSPRTTTWRVDYGVGQMPASFTAATATGTLTTGNRTFSNNTINVNFGTGLDNQAGPVWIRIVTLNSTTGSGNRPTTGIDDVVLSWTGTGTGTGVGSVSGRTTPVSILGRATSDRILVGFSAAKAEDYTLSLFSINGSEVARQTVRAAAGDNQAVLQPRGLAAGQYILRVSSSSAVGGVKVTVE